MEHEAFPSHTRTHTKKKRLVIWDPSQGGFGYRGTYLEPESLVLSNGLLHKVGIESSIALCHLDKYSCLVNLKAPPGAIEPLEAFGESDLVFSVLNWNRP